MHIFARVFLRTCIHTYELPALCLGTLVPDKTWGEEEKKRELGKIRRIKEVKERKEDIKKERGGGGGGGTLTVRTSEPCQGNSFLEWLTLSYHGETTERFVLSNFCSFKFLFFHIFLGELRGAM